MDLQLWKLKFHNCQQLGRKNPAEGLQHRKSPWPLSRKFLMMMYDENFEVEEVSALDAKKKGGRKPTANAKAAAGKPAATAKNKRGAANKQQPQLLGQTLLTEIFKPAETLGISPEKKVRKMRASPFNKKSGSVLGNSTGEEDETAETKENSGSASTSNSSSGGESNEVVMPARTRPQRANCVQTRYMLTAK